MIGHDGIKRNLEDLDSQTKFKKHTVNKHRTITEGNIKSEGQNTQAWHLFGAEVFSSAENASLIHDAGVSSFSS